MVAVTGGVYALVLDDGRRMDASLRGRLKLASRVRAEDRVVIGDRVEMTEPGGGNATIEALVPRRSSMVRRSGKTGKPRVLAANIDRVCAVVAVDPALPVGLIDRLLVAAESNRIPPVLVLNKIDLPGGPELAATLSARYLRVGYPVLEVSVRANVGIDALREELCRGTSALIGPSGAGKSTLLNVIEPGLHLRTGELSRATGSGRHTTVSSRLITLSCGGRVADTPGFSDVGMWEIDPGELDGCFPELREARAACRFRGCSHLQEPDCAVREAVESGRIARQRYGSYLTLRSEAESVWGR